MFYYRATSLIMLFTIPLFSFSIENPEYLLLSKITGITGLILSGEHNLKLRQPQLSPLDGKKNVLTLINTT